MKGSSRQFLIVTFAALGLAACSGEREGADRGTPSARTLPTTGEQPVRIGFDGPRFDACAAFGRITNLNPRGDNYLSVRNAPAISAEEIDRLGSGRGVAMCQQVGDWIGVVYAPESDPALDCGTGSPVPSVRDYQGPCKSGWVNENFIELIAG